MYDSNGLRIWGLCAIAVGAVGLVLCLVGLVNPGFALTQGRWLAGAGGFLVFVLVLAGDTALTWREKQAGIERTRTINDERELRNRERERRLDPPGKPEPAADYTADWRVMAHRFLAWGDRYGFTVRDLAEDDKPGKCIGWDDWGLMRAFLVEAGVLTGAGRNTRWNTADGWHWEKWQESRTALPLPLRTFEPPTVAIPVQHPTPQHPQHATEAAGG